MERMQSMWCWDDQSWGGQGVKVQHLRVVEHWRGSKSKSMNTGPGYSKRGYWWCHLTPVSQLHSSRPSPKTSNSLCHQSLPLLACLSSPTLNGQMSSPEPWSTLIASSPEHISNNNQEIEYLGIIVIKYGVAEAAKKVRNTREWTQAFRVYTKVVSFIFPPFNGGAWGLCGTNCLSLHGCHLSQSPHLY